MIHRRTLNQRALSWLSGLLGDVLIVIGLWQILSGILVASVGFGWLAGPSIVVGAILILIGFIVAWRL